MDCFIIEGPSKIDGEVEISGSKNSSLAILFATLLTDEKCVLNNVPQLMDIKTTYEILSFTGKSCFFGFKRFEVKEKSDIKAEAPYDLVRKMRASVLVAGPMLARFKYAKFSMPGGCAIGLRPIDIHLEGFKKFGADIQMQEGYVILKAKKIKPAVINLKFPSVGATENLMMAASLIEGKTVIKNAAKEPEIEDLSEVLNKMGAKVIGAGSDTITICGVKKLNGFTHTVIPDRIEAQTFMILGAMCGRVRVKNVCVKHCKNLIDKLKKSGAKVLIKDNFVEVIKPSKIKAVNVVTNPYPGFPTDIQAQWMAYMCLCDSKAKITENIFENRFMHVAELNRMGANISVSGNTAVVKGVKNLIGAVVMASDLRAGAGLILAAISAFGRSKIRRVYHIDRGYEKIEEKLSKLGARIKRVEE